MKTKKLNFEDFASNELSKNQKKTILGKGDVTIMSTSFMGDPIIVATTTTTPTVPPSAGSGANGDARITD
ncbi:MAG TPA: hypothetical protein VLB74_08600 [Flavobacterium sp.]|uniref:hypothetical protein n=1 Tax=Flavobacterium sp. TaxID=239 RepID=UPI002B6FF724|nr:hypothetical protein [Flavobacterium sp.]HSD14693.1 hypothetical protein [Flavobacterium sp.]